MADDNFFRTPEQEIALLLSRMDDLREQAVAINQQLGAMDKHLRRVFPELKKGAKKPTFKAPPVTASNSREIFDELTQVVRQGEASSVEGRLNKMSKPELVLVANAAGSAAGSKANKAGLIAAIRGKIGERVMLTS
jgi:hypothetical protein